MTVSLVDLYHQYQGTAIPSFDGNQKNNGQCVQWALMVRTKRDGLPVRYGNAIDWWTNRGSDVDHYDYIPHAFGIYPKTGDYVVWGAGVGSQFGHIDICAFDGNPVGFLGYDSNWLDIPKLTTVQHDYSLGILGYIRLKGQDMFNEGDRVNFNSREYGQDLGLHKELVSQQLSYKDAVAAAWSSSEWRDNARVNKGDVVNYFRALVGVEPVDADYAFHVGLTHKQSVYNLLGRGDVQKRLAAATGGDPKLIALAQALKEYLGS